MAYKAYGRNTYDILNCHLCAVIEVMLVAMVAQYD